MQRENIIAVQYTNSSFGFCIWHDSKFFVGNYIDEDEELSIMKSLIHKYSLMKILLSSEVSIEQYRLLKAICEVKLVDSRSFREGVESYSGCFKVTREYLNIKGVFLETSLDNQDNSALIQIGICDQFRVFSLTQSNHLYLDKQTMYDLDLVSSKYSDASLLKLLDFTKTSFGSDTLKSWLLHPLTNIEAITKRQDIITGIDHLNLSGTLSSIKSFYTAKDIDLIKLKSFLVHSLEIIKQLNGSLLQFKYSYVVYEQILENIDILEGENLKKGKCEAYDELKNTYEELPDRLDKIATNLAYRYQVKLSVIYFPHIGYLVEVPKANVEEYTLKRLVADDDEHYNSSSSIKSFIRTTDSRNNLESSYSNTQFSTSKASSMFGLSDFHLSANKFDDTFPKRHRNKSVTSEDISNSFSSKDKHDQDSFTPYSFLLKDTVFIKSRLMNKLDEELGDVYNLMEEMKNKKIKEVVDMIDFSLINHLRDFIGTVDAFNSLFLFKKQFNCIRPEIFYREEGYENCKWQIKILNFLNEKVDIDISKNLIYKGSQTIMKIVGQVSVLVQMGSFIPSDFVNIPLFDKIYTSLDVPESPGNSYFLSSIKRIGTILRFTSAKSLVLLDSLGYGTNSEEGLMIFKSIHRNVKFPIVLSLTQFSEIFSTSRELSNEKKFIMRFEVFRDSIRHLSVNACCEFDSFKSCLSGNQFEFEFIEEVEKEYKSLLNKK